MGISCQTKEGMNWNRPALDNDQRSTNPESIFFTKYAVYFELVKVNFHLRTKMANKSLILSKKYKFNCFKTNTLIFGEKVRIRTLRIPCSMSWAHYYFSFSVSWNFISKKKLGHSAAPIFPLPLLRPTTITPTLCVVLEDKTLTSSHSLFAKTWQNAAGNEN